METSNYIPTEVMELILIKLPLKSLKLFLTVSKDCYNTITSPQFLSKHLNFTNSLQDKTLFLVDSINEGKVYDHDAYVLNPESKVSYFHGLGRQSSYVLYSDDDGDKAFDDYAVLRAPAEGSTKAMYVSGCCNGLVCLTDDKQVLLWNPAIHRFLQLPVSRIGLRTQRMFTFGFVFDNITNDFKLLRINGAKKIEVFRLSTNIWELFTKEVPFNGQHGLQVDLKGFSHWIGTYMHTRFYPVKLMIISFDAHKEVFGSIQPPAGVEVHAFDIMCGSVPVFLFSFEESLVLICYYDDAAVFDLNYRDCWRRFEFWKMEEYGNAESWSLWHTYRFPDTRIPIGFRKNGQFLWVGARCRKFVSTNLDNCSETCLGRYEAGPVKKRMNHVESLALLDSTTTRIPPRNNDL